MEQDSRPWRRPTIDLESRRILLEHGFGRVRRETKANASFGIPRKHGECLIYGIHSAELVLRVIGAHYWIVMVRRSMLYVSR